MTHLLARLAGALHLREGEGNTLAIMAGFLFLNTANTTLLSAAKNGLFLSVYPGSLIPHAVIAAALLTAVTAIVFTGVISGTARRRLALWLTLGLVASILVARFLFEYDPRSSFLIYLWLSAVQVLVVTHAWDYVGDLLTGRQAKRLLPLIGMGASIGAILGGAAVVPAAGSFGTSNLLLISAGLLLAALPFLWAVPEPHTEEEEDAIDTGAVKAFFTGAGRGFRALGHEKLLRLLAFGIIALTLTGTLIDLQLKVALQENFTRDQITAVYGLMSTVVGTGTLFLQFWASRFLFPKLGVSMAAMLQGGALTLASGGLAVTGGVYALAGLQSLDDILQHALQKPVEQVSLLPFPGKIKSAAMATLGGVLSPLSKAAAGGLALALATRAELLPLITVASAAVAFMIYTRHRTTYMAALENALARHAVDFTGRNDTPFLVGREALAVIDKAFDDPDPTVVVFAASLLEQLPVEESIPRATKLLGHDIPEVRAEAATVLSRLEHDDDDFAAVAVVERLRTEDDFSVIAALVSAAGCLPGIRPKEIRRYEEHEDRAVRRAALGATTRLGDDNSEKLREFLGGDDHEARIVAVGVVGDLVLEEFLPEVADAIGDITARPMVLEALALLGKPAVPTMAGLLTRRDLSLPTRRSIVTALASIEGSAARDSLIALAEEPALGPAAMNSLLRMRVAGRIDPIDPATLQGTMEEEMAKGLRFSLAASGLRSMAGDNPEAIFVARELESLRTRSLHRVLRVLSLSYDTRRLSPVATALLSKDIARVSNALELLEGSISQDTAALVMPFMEAAAENFPEWRTIELVPDAITILQNPGETLTNEKDWWPRSLGLHVLGRDDEISTPGRHKNKADDAQEDEAMIPLIEKVMILKGSELFRNFPGPDLAGIASLAQVVYLEPDEVLFNQGEEGDAFYMVVQGGVRITRGSTELAILGTREGFGEMAILDQETRSATATAAEATTLLRIGQDSFDQLIEQNPTVARGIYRVLTERLRNTLEQVAAG